MTYAPLEDGEEPDALCGDCGDPLYAEELNVEAFETLGALLCDACFAERCDDDGQPDEQEEWLGYDPDC